MEDSDVDLIDSGFADTEREGELAEVVEPEDNQS